MMLRRITRMLPAAAAMLLLVAGTHVAAQNEATTLTTGQWISLFNGTDLTGWTPKITGQPFGQNERQVFRVEDGVIKGTHENYERFNGEFGHLFYERPFSNYILRVEYRFVGEQVPGGPSWATRNSGIMFHCQDPATMGIHQQFPVSIEVQMLGGDGTTTRTTGNLCTPGTNVIMNDRLITEHCILSSSKTYHGDQWVTQEIEVHGGGHIIHRVNGEVVIEYDSPQLDPNDADARPVIEAAGGKLELTGGYIALQAESHPVEFRKVEIMLLDESDVATEVAGS